ncbi:MAG: D-alanyl-D-alanine carboxypeptidase [Clostridia bacterium]|nr:D-alanyl-D-alanine carboxypeptidase [Clostridia bacterium]
MSGCKSLVAFLLVFSLSLLTFCPLRVNAEEPTTPFVSAESAVLIEAQSGNVIYSKNADQRLPMASTTKIITALTALSQAHPDTVITANADAVGVEGSSIYLVEGEALTLEQLLYALLLESANDAAVAIAIGVSGSVEAFAEQMNLLADVLGLQDTHFVNPHGLDHEDHYTTASELAKLTRYALQNELIREIVGTRKTTIPHPGEVGTRLLVNHNKLLRLYEDCIGVKTGFTKRSGRCLVSAAERDGVTLIAVTLNAPNDWNDHTAMLDYGFAKYESVLLCDNEEYLFPLSVVGGADSYVLLVNADPLRVTLPKKRDEITVTVEAPHFAYAPVAEGETLGQVVFQCDTDGDGTPEMIAKTTLNTCYSVLRYTPKRSFWNWLCALFGK